jgi:DNA (cytosine-5)-methyltransferase 1
MRKAYTAVDLFAGGGGLTVGLKEAGFRVVGAIEIEKAAYDTYVTNHPEVTAFLQDIRELKGRDLKALAPDGKIDLVSGCPPCQGFTSLTSKYKKRDARNALIREMIRLIKEIVPKAVMMENVPGLAVRGKHYLTEFMRELRKLGYIPKTKVLQVADFGVPQFRRRLVVLAGRGFEIEMPQTTHSKEGMDGKADWVTVREAIGGLETRPVTLRKALEGDGPRAFDWHIIREISAENVARLRAARAGKDWSEIPEKLRPKCHQDGYRGFTNVYGRMRWAAVSPTITGGCTTLSKGRFGHPQANRTISVKEAALLQTFPADYVFDTDKMERVCDIVGNALPCRFAAAVALQCYGALTSGESASRLRKRTAKNKSRPN